MIAFFRFLPVSLSLLASVVLLNGIFRTHTSVYGYKRLLHNKKIMLDSLEGKRAKNKSLENKIHRLMSSRVYARKLLRDRYHFREDGEDMMYISD